MSDFGKNLKSIRIKRGQSQQAFSEYLNVSRVYISDLERNKKLPHIHFLIDFADKFDVSIDWLLGRKFSVLDTGGLPDHIVQAINTVVSELKK